jgi:hypothetical protein
MLRRSDEHFASHAICMIAVGKNGRTTGLTVHLFAAKGDLLRRILVMLCAAAALCASLAAQSPTGSISGIVFDPDAKTVPGAEIIVVNDLTRVQYETKTNEAGIYAVPNLPPGPYRVQVSKVGFKTLIKPDIVLNVQDAITVNFALPVGATSIAVTVEGGAPMINTTDATVSTVVDRQFAENLPLNGRSFQTLIYMTPGVVPTASTTGDSGQFSVNGQRAASNYWTVDGVSANFGVGAATSAGNGIGGTLGALSALGGTNGLVSVDSLQEFRIQTSTFAPEFGRTPGGQISIVTRSGANAFHGTAFDYLRNDIFDASNWFNGYTNNPPLPKAEERQNDFGGTLGGPIHKDNTFFFFSYEGLRLRLPTTAITFVPDEAARSSATAALRPYLNAFPLPTGHDDPTTGIAQASASYSNPATLDAYSLRIDQNFRGRVTIFGRYNYSPSQFVQRGSAGGFGSLSVLQPFRVTTQTATGGVTWTVSPAWTNDLRANYSHSNAETHLEMDNFGGAVPLAVLPFPNGIRENESLFEFDILSLGNSGLIGVGATNQNVQRQFNVVDNLSWLKGTHAVKFGVDYRRLSPTVTGASYLQGAFFSDVPSAAEGTSLFGAIESTIPVNLLFQNLGAYAQDTWKVSRGLTLTYGLRWDIDCSPSGRGGPAIPAITGFNPTDLSKIAIAPPGTPSFQTTYNNVAPRVGLAYALRPDSNHALVLHAGVGVFYDLVSAESGSMVSVGVPPFGNENQFFDSPFPFTAAESAPPAIAPTGSIAEFSAFNPNLKLPYTLQWNVSLQQSLGNDQVFTATYLGASGRRLLQSTIYFFPVSNPNVEEGILVGNGASSEYNALQVQFQRRLSRGLQALASYTFSHSIDDGSASSTGDVSNTGVPGSSSQNRGDSDFDIRHSFTAGMTYSVPAPWHNTFLKTVFRDWSTENFLLARSAPPVDLTDLAFFELRNGIFTNIRPDVVSGQPQYLYGSQFPGGKALNPAAFASAPADPTTGTPLRQGNLGRNALRGFGATEWDFAVHRDFPIRESVKLQFRAEIFNLLNHPNFGPPNGHFGGAGFGLASNMLGQSLAGGSLSGGLNPLYQIGGPRSAQFALKLFF